MVICLNRGFSQITQIARILNNAHPVQSECGDVSCVIRDIRRDRHTTANKRCHTGTQKSL